MKRFRKSTIGRCVVVIGELVVARGRVRLAAADAFHPALAGRRLVGGGHSGGPIM